MRNIEQTSGTKVFPNVAPLNPRVGTLGISTIVWTRDLTPIIAKLISLSMQTSTTVAEKDYGNMVLLLVGNTLHMVHIGRIK